LTGLRKKPAPALPGFTDKRRLGKTSRDSRALGKLALPLPLDCEGNHVLDSNAASQLLAHDGSRWSISA